MLKAKHLLRWRFAEENNIQLTDEYDMIHRDLEPFFGLPPRIFKARNYQLGNDPNFSLSSVSFSMNIKDGQLSISGPLKEASRARETRDLMDGFAKYLPDMSVTFTGHDGPGIFLAGEIKERYLEAAREGVYLGDEDYEATGDLPEHPGWSAACPPGSNWRRSLFGNSISKPSAK